MNLDAFNNAISFPVLTMINLFNSMPRGDFFTTPSKNNSDIVDVIKENLVGGPSIIFQRHVEVVVKIREHRYKDDAKTVQNVIGYDANSLYLYCLSMEMATGFPIRRKPQDNFHPVKTFSISQVAMECLEYETLKRGI